MKRALILIPMLLAAALPSQATMTGCTVEILSPHLAFPDTDVVFHFYVHNGSPDGEATSEVQFRFADLFLVQGGWFDDGGQGWSFATEIFGSYNSFIRFYDADGDGGEIQPGTGGHFYVPVHIDDNSACDEYVFHGKQFGDGAGGLPHWISQELPFVLCTVPVASSTWSTVKSLY
jgi:hypothetical protein